MGKGLIIVFIMTLWLLTSCDSESNQQLESSQSDSLLRLKHLLYFPAIMSDWNHNTDFCNSEPNPSLTVVCYQNMTITQLHIIGPNEAHLLPLNFSIHSFFKAISKLPDLRVLTLVSLGLWGRLPREIQRLSSLEILNVTSNFLYGEIPQEISSLTSLETLILDHNMLSGSLPSWLNSLPLLTVLSLKHNMFNGSLPVSLSYLDNLRVLVLSGNNLYGDVPDLSRLINLQVLELSCNALGPKFPRLGNKLVTISLNNNSFRSSIPSEIDSCYQLRRIDISFNSFVGPFPRSLLMLPSVNYVNVEGNKLTGMLLSNQSCSEDLEFVDLSSNLLTGNVPDCLLERSKSGGDVLYAKNCLSTSEQDQFPFQHCHNEAFAVGISPMKNKPKQVSKTSLVFLIVGCSFGALVIACITLVMYTKLGSKRIHKSATENASTGTTGYTSKLLSGTRLISQTNNTEEVSVPVYRTFSLEELNEATNNFDPSALMVEECSDQEMMYRGLLKDGCYVCIRCRKMKRKQAIESYKQLIEIVSKLRHRNLVSAIGHCFEYYSNDSTIRTIFLVFEYVPNGTLRSWISEGNCKALFSWTQRISTAIGIAKGIGFLHANGFLYINHLNITDVLIDYSFNAKINCYKLLLLPNYRDDKLLFIEDGNERVVLKDEKNDVYEFGVILLELIKGRQVKSQKQVDALIDQIQVAIMGDKEGRRSMVDPSINTTCLDQSLKTIMEICVKCLQTNHEDRPSIEDILWNLQYASQVQEYVSSM